MDFNVVETFRRLVTSTKSADTKLDILDSVPTAAVPHIYDVIEDILKTDARVTVYTKAASLIGEYIASTQPVSLQTVRSIPQSLVLTMYKHENKDMRSMGLSLMLANKPGFASLIMQHANGDTARAAEAMNMCASGDHVECIREGKYSNKVFMLDNDNAPSEFSLTILGEGLRSVDEEVRTAAFCSLKTYTSIPFAFIMSAIVDGVGSGHLSFSFNPTSGTTDSSIYELCEHADVPFTFLEASEKVRLPKKSLLSVCKGCKTIPESFALNILEKYGDDVETYKALGLTNVPEDILVDTLSRSVEGYTKEQRVFVYQLRSWLHSREHTIPSSLEMKLLNAKTLKGKEAGISILKWGNVEELPADFLMQYIKNLTISDEEGEHNIPLSEAFAIIDYYITYLRRNKEKRVDRSFVDFVIDAIEKDTKEVFFSRARFTALPIYLEEAITIYNGLCEQDIVSWFQRNTRTSMEAAYLGCVKNNVFPAYLEQHISEKGCYVYDHRLDGYGCMSDFYVLYSNSVGAQIGYSTLPTEKLQEIIINDNNVDDAVVSELYKRTDVTEEFLLALFNNKKKYGIARKYLRMSFQRCGAE